MMSKLLKIGKASRGGGKTSRSIVCQSEWSDFGCRCQPLIPRLRFASVEMKAILAKREGAKRDARILSSPRRLTYVTAFLFRLRYKGIRKLGSSCASRLAGLRCSL